jgi:hypothetical protein
MSGWTKGKWGDTLWGGGLNIWGVDKTREQFTLPNNQDKLNSEKAIAAIPAPTSVDELTKASTAQAKSATLKKRISASRSQSIYTSPLGLGTQASVNSKTLLGM